MASALVCGWHVTLSLSAEVNRFYKTDDDDDKDNHIKTSCVGHLLHCARDSGEMVSNSHNLGRQGPFSHLEIRKEARGVGYLISSYTPTTWKKQN